MLALATSIKIRAKIDEILHVFWKVDFEGFSGGFWEGFGKPKSSIFDFFLRFCDINVEVHFKGLQLAKLSRSRGGEWLRCGKNVAGRTHLRAYI